MLAPSGVPAFLPGPQDLHREQLCRDGSQADGGHGAAALPTVAVSQLQTSRSLCVRAATPVRHSNHPESTQHCLRTSAIFDIS